MEQAETSEIMAQYKNIIHKPKLRWDPEKAGKRKVRVVKVPYGQDPMKEKTIFEFGGFVYICYAVKTRGRYMIRCLGMAEVEKPAQPALTPFEAGKLLDDAADGMGDNVKDAVDDEIIDNLSNED